MAKTGKISDGNIGYGIATSIAKSGHGKIGGTMNKKDSSKTEGKKHPLFATFLKVCRTEKRITIAGLSEKSGVSAPYISNLESDKFHTPTKEVIDKLANGLGLDTLERQILYRTAGDKSSLFAPGLDIRIENSLEFQDDDRLKEVYIVAEDVLETKEDKELFEHVAENIRRGVKYTYFIKDRDKFQPLMYNLEAKIGEDISKKRVSCITASNYFLFHPGFMIIKKENPNEIIGFYAKWVQGNPCRLYEMEESDCDFRHKILDNACQTLEHKLTYDSDLLGKVVKEYPDNLTQDRNR